MTQCQEELVQHLRMFGLVYQRKVQLPSIVVKTLCEFNTISIVFCEKLC